MNSFYQAFLSNLSIYQAFPSNLSIYQAFLSKPFYTFNFQSNLSIQLTCFKGCIEAKMASLGLAGMTRRPHHDPLDVAQATLGVGVVRVWKFIIKM